MNFDLNMVYHNYGFGTYSRSAEPSHLVSVLANDPGSVLCTFRPRPEGIYRGTSQYVTGLTYLIDANSLWEVLFEKFKL